MPKLKRVTWPLTALSLIVAMVLGSCLYRWDIPARKNGKYVVRQDGGSLPEDLSNDYEDSHRYVVPINLLANATTADGARTCAVMANRFHTKAIWNNVWSILFGVVQVTGAATGTVAAGAAFEATNNDKAAKTAAISFAVAAGIAALDRAYGPGQLSSDQSRVEQKIGHLILLAAAQLATGKPGDARASLSLCMDPANIDDSRTLINLNDLQKQINDLAKQMAGDGGVDSR
ncbi:MAG TPA: hypothetical protein VKZ18_02855 [Polyangia bacterium]|nr:hypothetical protein [Polyangia bacterium]